MVKKPIADTLHILDSIRWDPSPESIFFSVLWQERKVRVAISKDALAFLAGEERDLSRGDWRKVTAKHEAAIVRVILAALAANRAIGNALHLTSDDFREQQP